MYSYCAGLSTFILCTLICLLSLQELSHNIFKESESLYTAIHNSKPCMCGPSMCACEDATSAHVYSASALKGVILIGRKHYIESVS